jgi:hypothetical protein
MNNNFDRSAICRRAHQLRRLQGLDMSTAMKAAWAPRPRARQCRLWRLRTANGLLWRLPVRRYRLDRVARRGRTQSGPNDERLDRAPVAYPDMEPLGQTQC